MLKLFALWRSFKKLYRIVKWQSLFVRWRTNEKNRYSSPNPTLSVTQTVTLALVLTQTLTIILKIKESKWASILLLFGVLFFLSSSYLYARVQISSKALTC